MAAFTFDQLLAKGVRAGKIPGRTQDAREWYRTAAKKTSVSDSQLMRSDREALRRTPSTGRMYAFFYDPKHKETLPYYDRFPLIFKIKNVPGGFLGMNLHYLPPALRARLMDALYDLVTNQRYDESTRLKLSYDVLNSAAKFRFFKPTIKMYLNKHVRSRFLLIDAVEWDMALFLPTERFEKAGKTRVWSDSRGMI